MKTSISCTNTSSSLISASKKKTDFAHQLKSQTNKITALQPGAFWDLCTYPEFKAQIVIP